MSMIALSQLQQELFAKIATPEFRQLTFDPVQRSGMIRDGRGVGSFNLGVDGLIALVRCANGAADWQLERLLDDAGVARFRSWLPMFRHISNGTVPPPSWPDERGMLLCEYQQNRSTYELIGFAPPMLA